MSRYTKPRGAMMYRYEGIARKCVTADDVALINAMPEGWWPLQTLVDVTGSPRQTLRKVLERQSHTGVIEIKEDDAWYLKTKRTRFVYRRTNKEPQPYTPKPSVYRRERKSESYRDRRIGKDTAPPTPEVIAMRAHEELIETYGRWHVSHIKRLAPMSNGAIVGMYLKEWKALRRTWQPYTIPAEPVTATDYNPAPDHPWRATQDRRTA
jgi:hypothetical protein